MREEEDRRKAPRTVGVSNACSSYRVECNQYRDRGRSGAYSNCSFLD